MFLSLYLLKHLTVDGKIYKDEDLTICPESV